MLLCRLYCAHLGLIRLIYEESDVQLMYKDGEVALGSFLFPLRSSI